MTRNLCVLTLTDYFPPHTGGGVERVAYELTRRMAQNGHEMHVVTIDTTPAPREEVLEGVHVHRVGGMDLSSRLGIQASFSYGFYRRVAQLCNEISPDIIHAHNRFFQASLIGAWLRRRKGTPFIMTMHLGSVSSLGRTYGTLAGIYEQILGKWILKNADATIAVSQAVADHGIRLGVPIDRLHVIPNGVDAGLFEPLDWGQKREAPTIVCVGRLIFNKGPQFLVDALPEILQKVPKSRVIFVGEGPLKAPLQNQLAKAGLLGQVEFLGARTDVHTILREAHLFVRCSLSEGMPLTVLEAMASGLPVVVSPVSGTVELVENGVTGLFVDPGDKDGLVEAVTYLLNDQTAGRRMGNAGRKKVETGYSWESVVEATLPVYEKVLQMRGQL